MEQPSSNPLVSSKPSDSGITVALHPLVLLTASDQITRSRVRGDKRPVVGVLLGQQKGREITIEHAFAAAVADGNTGFDGQWLETRATQYRDVHKAPALDVVGWFTLAPEDGPIPELIPFQRHITSVYNDSAVLLAIHPSAFEQSTAADRKLPITVYESVVETDVVKDDSSMQVDGNENFGLSFRAVPYTIETDEAEMIAINFVSKGAGSAAAVQDAQPSATNNKQPSEDKKGKKRATPEATEPKSSTPTSQEVLSSEEQDQIANLTTRLNSVRMLQSRLALINSFVRALPPSYLSDSSTPVTSESPNPGALPHLRNLQSLLTTLALLTPTDTGTQTNLKAARDAQRNDVTLTQLLNTLGKDVQNIQELGKTFSTIDAARASGKRKNASSGMSFDMDSPLGNMPSMGGFQGAGGRSMLT